jgi:glycosyltransferase involved in cell wall biosynthesis
VLAVGAAEKRKNHALLERAMCSVVVAHHGTTLVLAGPRRRTTAPAADFAWMQTLGFVSDAELATLYRNAAALVMPSTYEGFGLPVLEAMQLGTPVICARASSLPEVAGDAALWVKPDDHAELAAAIASVLDDQALRAALSASSLRQARTFSWDHTARNTLQAFDDAHELYRLAQRAGTPASPMVSATA